MLLSKYLKQILRETGQEHLLGVHTGLHTSTVFIYFPKKASGHLGLALKLHQSPEMESSGEKNQILICKMVKGGLCTDGTLDSLHLFILDRLSSVY